MMNMILEMTAMICPTVAIQRANPYSGWSELNPPWSNIAWEWGRPTTVHTTGGQHMCDCVTVVREPGRVTAILNSQLFTNLWSLVIRYKYIYIYYHSDPCLQLYSNPCNTYTYEAKRRHMYHYTIMAILVNRYVSLSGLQVDEFYPIFRHATSWSQQFRILSSKQDIEALLLQRMKSQPFDFSIELLMATE
jgi:hypothetical protein